MHVPFTAGMIGAFDTQLTFEFFQGFVNHAGVTLHIDNLKVSMPVIRPKPCSRPLRVPCAWRLRVDPPWATPFLLPQGLSLSLTEALPPGFAEFCSSDLPVPF